MLNKFKFNFDCCHPEWEEILENALNAMDTNYLKELIDVPGWFPGLNKMLSAFYLPLSQTDYILLGESPYPRSDSANGFAFWDNSVDLFWSEKGLSKSVNIATSL